MLLVVLFAGQPTARAQSATQLVERMQRKYDSIDALRADFTQTTAVPGFEESISGRLVLQGDAYRLETDQQTFVNNGEVTWIYNAPENQVLIDRSGLDASSFSINDFFFNYADRYAARAAEIVQHDGVKHYRLSLTPKAQDSYFTDITLWLRDSDTVVTQIEVEDAGGTTMRFVLEAIEINPALGPETFTFTPPAGAHVIDQR